MMMKAFGLVLLFTILAVSVVADEEVKWCETHRDCGVEECCVVPSSPPWKSKPKPRCTPLATEGDLCTSDEYAGTETHDYFCQCGEGLSCEMTFERTWWGHWDIERCVVTTSPEEKEDIDETEDPEEKEDSDETEAQKEE